MAGSSSWSFWQKSGAIIGSGAVISGVLYYAYKHYNRDDCECCKDEGFVDVAKGEEPAEQKVLVLGLDGAGKSSLLLGLTSNDGPLTVQPTDGFNVVYLTTGKLPMALWEIGGSPSKRKYWSSFVQDTRVLVYVVDSANDKRLPEAFSELHRILGDERLNHVPIIIVATKQDLPGAMNRDSILRALAMDNVNKKRMNVNYIAAEAPPSGAFVGLGELQSLLDRLSASAS